MRRAFRPCNMAPTDSHEVSVPIASLPGQSLHLPSLPHSVRSVFRLSLPLDGLLLRPATGLVSYRIRFWDCALQSVPLAESWPTSSAAHTLLLLSTHHSGRPHLCLALRFDNRTRVALRAGSWTEALRTTHALPVWSYRAETTQSHDSYARNILASQQAEKR